MILVPHLNAYVVSEKHASNWALKTDRKKTPYAGYLADVARDLSLNPSLIPVLASPEISAFLSGSDNQDDLVTFNASEANKIKIEKRALQLGFRTLSDLPDIGFSGIEEVMKLKDKLTGELHEYNMRMRQVATQISETGSENFEGALLHTINTDLVPKIHQLKKAVEQCKKDFDKWLIPTTAFSTGGAMVSSMMGLGTELTCAFAIPALSELCRSASSVSAMRRKQRELLADEQYFGLSLTLKRKRLKYHLMRRVRDVLPRNERKPWG